jgi:glycerol-3-phosphate dehydrogenase (NAD(P)+)
MKKVAILGAGVMGSAMAVPFADRGMDVRLVGTFLDDAIVAEVSAHHFHPKLKATLPRNVKAYSHQNIAQAIDNDTDFILLGVASAGVAWAIEQLCAVLKKPIPIVMITKGLSPQADQLLAFPDVVQEALQQRLGLRFPVAAIGGPCIAGELAVRRHTGTVIVSRDVGLAAELCQAFATDYYHPTPSFDMIGVELCAAFKNFFAIAVGWAHGQMEVLAETENAARNNNAAAVLFDQAVREMIALTKALGGNAESVWGMPGVGDLYVTCQAGRNSRLGNHLGRGLTYNQVKSSVMKDDTIEGAELGRAIAPTVMAMIGSGTLRAGDLPLTLALLDCLTLEKPLLPPWALFHRSS